MIRNLLSSVFGKTSVSGGRNRKKMSHRERPRPTRLSLERLDERVVPAIFNVTNGGNDGPGSLRQAILAANANPGSDVIQFYTSVGLTTKLPEVTESCEFDGQQLKADGSPNTVVARAAGSGFVSPGMPPSTVPHFRLFTVYPNGSEFTFNRIWFLNGWADSSSAFGPGGGAIWSWGQLHVNWCFFTENHADGSGGAIYQNQASMTMDNCHQVMGNTAGGSGGGIYFTSAGAQNLTVTDSVIDYNTANVNGGGIFYYATGNLWLTGDDVSMNRATTGSGGGIYAGLCDSLRIIGGLGVNLNIAPGIGCGIYVMARAEVTIDTSVNGNMGNVVGVYIITMQITNVFIGPGVGDVVVIV
jgi:predicted outer membrane repeat protein